MGCAGGGEEAVELWTPMSVCVKFVKASERAGSSGFDDQNLMS